jgi:hypothetical protein
MSPRDLLGVFVRATGLAFITFGVFDLYYIFNKFLGLETGSQLPIWRDARGFLFWSLFGLAIVLGAKLIVRFAYWREPQA